MLADAAPFLACPHCRAAMELADEVLRCPSGHTFDVARQGYVSLLTGDAQGGTADTAEMVAAREAFLAAGHFRFIAEEVAARAAGARPGACAVDLGAGTGYHLAAVLDRLPGQVGLALDLSRYALRRAARAHPRMAAVRCDVWRRLPLQDGCASVVLNVFAPRQAAEIRRVLRPGGLLIVVTPTAHHLTELVGPLGLLTVDPRKEQRLAEQLEPLLTRVEQATAEQTLTLTHADVRAAVGMGPSAWHTDPQSLAGRVAALPEPSTVTASVTISVSRR